MATLDLSLVTLTLRSLLHKNVRRLLGGIAENQLEVTTMPPEQVNASTQTLNLHLYHISEDAHYKNAVGMDMATPPISGQPMALKLYYILTPHLTNANVFDAETQQKLMGLAMKTLHDQPVITDTLQITPVPGLPSETVMHDDLLNGHNRIEVALRPLEPEETINFWAAEDQKTPRLSAFYEVSVVMMQPEEPARSSGTVFDVGLYVESSPSAKVIGSRSQISFTMPASTGLGAQVLDVTPARTTLQPAIVLDKHPVRITGHNLTAGDAQSVAIKAKSWTVPLAIDPALNPSWALTILPEQINFVPQPALIVDDGAGGTFSQAITPEPYDVSLTITSYRFQAGARLDSSYDAGSAGLSIGAHITGIAGPIANRFQVDVSSAYDLTLAGDEINLIVGGEIYTMVNAFAAPPDDIRTFRVFADHVIFSPHFSLANTAAFPVQLFVNGLESQPFWVEV